MTQSTVWVHHPQRTSLYTKKENSFHLSWFIHPHSHILIEETVTAVSSGCILRVPDQNGISQVRYVELEIYHSGPEPFDMHSHSFKNKQGNTNEETSKTGP